MQVTEGPCSRHWDVLRVNWGHPSVSQVSALVGACQSIDHIRGHPCERQTGAAVLLHHHSVAIGPRKEKQRKTSVQLKGPKSQKQKTKQGTQRDVFSLRGAKRRTLTSRQRQWTFQILSVTNQPTQRSPTRPCHGSRLHGLWVAPVQLLNDPHIQPVKSTFGSLGS